MEVELRSQEECQDIRLTARGSQKEEKERERESSRFGERGVKQ